jgi:transcriptional regulator, XRE family
MKNEIAKKIGANLREARKLKGISQKELAAELGKKQPEYSDYETGKIQLDYEKIIFLCKKLDITPNELFDTD